MNDVSRLVLGAAQFGMSYGIMNKLGRPTQDTVSSILDYSHGVGIKSIDTAMMYGASEQVLGDVGVNNWAVSTKLPEVPRACSDIGEWVRTTVDASMKRLQVGSLQGLLLHRPSSLLEHKGGHEAIQALKESGVVEKIGISIYDVDELNILIGEFKFDAVQLPFNVFDRRLLKSGWLMRLKDHGIEIQARSVFLQGLLLQNANALPKGFTAWKGLWIRWHEWLSDNNFSSLKASLGFVLSQQEVDKVIVGVDSLSQINEIVSAVSNEAIVVPEDLYSSDLDLIDPRRWS